MVWALRDLKIEGFTVKRKNGKNQKCTKIRGGRPPTRVKGGDVIHPPSLFKKTFERVEPSNFLFFQMSPKTKIRNDSSERGSRIISYQKIMDLLSKIIDFCKK